MFGERNRGATRTLDEKGGGRAGHSAAIASARPALRQTKRIVERVPV